MEGFFLNPKKATDKICLTESSYMELLSLFFIRMLEERPNGMISLNAHDVLTIDPRNYEIEITHNYFFGIDLRFSKKPAVKLEHPILPITPEAMKVCSIARTLNPSEHGSFSLDVLREIEKEFPGQLHAMILNSGVVVRYHHSDRWSERLIKLCTAFEKWKKNNAAITDATSNASSVYPVDNGRTDGGAGPNTNTSIGG